MTLWPAFLTAFVPLFVVVDPLAAAAVFAGMTANRSRTDVRLIAKRASIAGALILAFFALFGGVVFSALRLDVDALRAAGGVLLLLTAVDMLRAKRSDCRCSKAELEDGALRDDIALVPVATPLLAGPGAIATVLALSGESQGASSTVGILLAIAATFGLGFLALRGAGLIQRIVPKAGLMLIERLMGLVLAAFAVQLLAIGLAGLWAA